MSSPEKYTHTRLRNYAHTTTRSLLVVKFMLGLKKTTFTLSPRCRPAGPRPLWPAELMCEDGGEPKLGSEGGGVPLVLLPHLSPESRVPVRPAGPLRPDRAALPRLLPGGLGPQGLPLFAGRRDQSQQPRRPVGPHQHHGRGGA